MDDKQQLIGQIQASLDIIRPYLQADGGDISFVELTDDMRVLVRLKGACSDCPMSIQTLKGGVEMVVKTNVPQVVEVVAVTD
jgi:Fe-S cluster biogenesis protein NfuA